MPRTVDHTAVVSNDPAPFAAHYADAMRDRDRHGRIRHVDGDARRRPAEGFRPAGGHRRFADLVEDALSELPEQVLRELADAVLAVEDVPPDEPVVGPGPWEPPLARLALTSPRRLTVYRRAIELRATSRMELAETIRGGAVEAVAEALGWPDDAWDWD